jgi:hypothetical protein
MDRKELEVQLPKHKDITYSQGKLEYGECIDKLNSVLDTT